MFAALAPILIQVIPSLIQLADDLLSKKPKAGQDKMDLVVQMIRTAVDKQVVSAKWPALPTDDELRGLVQTVFTHQNKEPSEVVSAGPKLYLVRGTILTELEPR